LTDSPCAGTLKPSDCGLSFPVQSGHKARHALGGLCRQRRALPSHGASRPSRQPQCSRRFRRAFTHFSTVSQDMKGSPEVSGARRMRRPLETQKEMEDEENGQGRWMCVYGKPASRVRSQLAGAHFTECCFTQRRCRGPFGRHRACGRRMRSWRVARALGPLSLHTILGPNARRRLCFRLQRLPAWLLAWPVGQLPQHPVPWTAPRRGVVLARAINDP
jgi:hypothetical protein